MIAPICYFLVKLPRSFTRSLCMHAPGRRYTVLPRNALLLFSYPHRLPRSHFVNALSPPNISALISLSSLSSVDLQHVPQDNPYVSVGLAILSVALLELLNILLNRLVDTAL